MRLGFERLKWIFDIFSLVLYNIAPRLSPRKPHRFRDMMMPVTTSQMTRATECSECTDLKPRWN